MKMNLSMLARRWRRKLYERAGSDRFSRPSLHGLDRKLERWLSYRGGVFLEAGANDGYEQSNTYYFERMRGWSGLLVEPVPWLAKQCRRNRGRSIVVQAALVPFNYSEDTIELDYSNLTSSVRGAFGDEDQRQRHQRNGLVVQPTVAGCRLRVSARTLQRVCEENGMARAFDFLSLDVEGAEPMVLGGVDFDRVRPEWMLIEVRDEQVISPVVGSHYEIVAVLTETSHYKDVLYRRRG